jgi:hypothetical protein
MVPFAGFILSMVEGLRGRLPGHQPATRKTYYI